MSQFVYRAPPFEFAKLDENILSLIVTLLELFICIAPPYLPIFSWNSLLIIDMLLFIPSKYIPPPPSSYELCAILVSNTEFVTNKSLFDTYIAPPELDASQFVNVQLFTFNVPFSTPIQPPLYPITYCFPSI